MNNSSYRMKPIDYYGVCIYVIFNYTFNHGFLQHTYYYINIHDNYYD